MGNLPQSKVAEVVPNTLNCDRNTLKIELHNSLTLPETRVSLWKLNLVESSPKGDLIFIAEGEKIYCFESANICTPNGKKEPFHILELERAGHDINFVKCGTCCGLEILASVDDGNGINIFYIDHIRAVLHNQKLKEQAKNSSGHFINEEKWKRIFILGDESTWGISICRDQPLICVSSNAHTVNIFNLDSVNLYKDKITVTGHQHNIPSIDITPCGKYLLTISIDSTARIWYLNHDDKTATEIGKKNIGNSWGWYCSWVPKHTVRNELPQPDNLIWLLETMQPDNTLDISHYTTLEHIEQLLAKRKQKKKRSSGRTDERSKNDPESTSYATVSMVSIEPEEEEDDEYMDEREEDDSMDDYDENDNDENMTTSSPVINAQNNNASDEGGVWPISPSAAELFNTLRNINANTNQMTDIVDFMEENLGEELEEDEEYSEEEEEDDDEISEPSPKRQRLSEPEANYTPETQEELKNLPQVHFFNKMKSPGSGLSSSQAENLLRTSSGGVSSLTSSTANLRASQNSILLNNSSPSIIGNSTAANQDKATIVPPIDQLALCTDFSSLFVYDAAGFKKVAELANCLPSTPGTTILQHMERLSICKYLPEISAGLAVSQGCCSLLLFRLVRNMVDMSFEIIPEARIPEGPIILSPVVGMTVIRCVQRGTNGTRSLFYRLILAFHTARVLVYNLKPKVEVNWQYLDENNIPLQVMSSE